MNGLVPANLRQLVAARRAYFEQGVTPDGLIDDAIYRSWTRCVAADRREVEMVEFAPVGRSHLRELMERNGPLLQAAKGPLDELTNAVSGAGYAVLLTDSHGYALSVEGAVEKQGGPIRQAFRLGVDLSEHTIGTSAMACALAERRAVRVFGPEHFFSAIHGFHCAAAPIMDPEGKVIGAVDITRDSPKPDLGALSLVSQCAQAIERELFRHLPFFLTLNLSWHEAPAGNQQDLIFALGADGEILALNENALRFTGLATRQPGLYFEDLFEGRFGHYATLLRDASERLPIRLRSGLCLYASNGNQRPTPCSRPVSRGLPVEAPCLARFSKQLPEFGDTTIVMQINMALRAMGKGLPLLIQGETGTGKDVVANALHAQGGQSQGQFVAINCAAIPENLIEGELFGHVEGAYTGARRGGAPGRIEIADGGTLFLDEIGDMPLQLQARMLRVLETREVSRLGTTASRKVDFQLICATHQDLPRAIKEGRFREDLYYRINGFTMELSPLRARHDIASLAHAMLNSICEGEREFSTEALALLQHYAWPGNVRELKHGLTYACAITEAGDVLYPKHFPPQILSTTQASKVVGILDNLKEDAIQRALAQTGGHVPSAAKILGMSRATLYRRLRKQTK